MLENKLLIFTCSLLFLVSLSMGGIGCSQKPVEEKIIDLNNQELDLNQDFIFSIGEVFKNCLKEQSTFSYAAKSQEFGKPWLKTDTFFFYHTQHQIIDIIFLGGADNVDSAKKRIEARMPLFQTIIKNCATSYELDLEKLKNNIHFTYTHVDQNSGNLKDIIYFNQVKFDFPNNGIELYYSKWFENRSQLKSTSKF